MSKQLRIGILGGGQLGRMLLQVAANYPVHTNVLEQGADAPAAKLCHSFTDGDIRDFDTVYAFGKTVDVLTIEIENVNLEALFKLEEEGLTIYPRPHALKIIKDKGLQKQFYYDHHIPTSNFYLLNTKAELEAKADFLPAALKLREGGYDGKGVELMRSTADFVRAFDEPTVLEKMVDIDKEIAVMAAKNAAGELAVYPPVEMVFDPRYNLVDFLLAPAALTEAQTKAAQALALKVVEALDSPGIFAVEMFLDKSGNILVNETAPRTHNSGHQSIEGNYSSQYDMQMRVLQNLPLGDTSNVQPSLMLNLIGEPGFSGEAVYSGLDLVMKLPKVYVHLYGKTHTKPGRKMGHVTILGNNTEELMQKAAFVKQALKVIA